ncbi:MAG: hypothetical protein ACRC62_30900 [Microcoleus sp.]
MCSRQIKLRLRFSKAQVRSNPQERGGESDNYQFPTINYQLSTLN